MNINPYSTYIYYIINNRRFQLQDSNEWQTAIMNNEELPFIKKFTQKYKLTNEDQQVIKMYNDFVYKPNVLYFGNLDTNQKKMVSSGDINDKEFKVIMSKIDEFINGLDIKELLKKPDFFRDKIESEPLYEIYKNDREGTEFKDQYILDSSRGNSQFSQKKVLYDLITDFINRDHIFSDSKEKLIFAFQYLINKTFNTIIEKFIEEYNKLQESPKLENGDIIFLYKGGVTLKMLYRKYLDILKNENNKEFLLSIQDNFKRSDNDYAIILNSIKITGETYNKIYYELNKVIVNLLNKLKDFLNKNQNFLFPINTPDLEEKSEELINKINTNIENINNNNNKESIFKNLKCIGISFGEKSTFIEDLPSNLNNKNTFNFNERISDKTKTNDYKETPNISVNFKKNITTDTKRNDFYVTAIQDENNKKISKIILLGENDSPFFLYHNETNYLITNFKTNFNLHRLKYNVKCYLKQNINGQIKYGFLNIPSEILDLPIPKVNDYKTKNYKTKDYIKEYFNKNKLLDLKFNMNIYNIEGFIKDLKLILFEESKFKPWNDDKYLKRVNRLKFLIFIKLLNDSDNQVDFNSKKGKEFKDLIDKIPEEIKLKEEEKFEKFKKALSLDNLEFEEIEKEMEKDEEELPYLKKYLKYKQKYLQLRKSLN